MIQLGELAALGAALCWALTALFFAHAGARVGSLVVNFLRLVMAIAMLSALGWALRGLPWPTDATPHAWLWLSISGLVGFTFGDLCLFRALVMIGPRLGSLLMSFAPPFAAIIGWLVLGETLRLDQWFGMALTMGGVAWALSDRTPRGNGAPLDRRTLIIGVALGIGGALGQAGGLVLSKFGMADYDPFAATQVRVLAGSVGFAVIFTVTRRWSRVRAAIRQRGAMLTTSAGAVFGPFLGVSLSLVAVQNTSAGVAASLMAISPVLVIPIVVLWQRERVGLGGVLGTVLAVMGVIVLVR
ncbi:MAG: DMT family transporter [Deltaproteobacteria bacterium]|nr:DMT family transporter [Deltaproteobacteria bacterium]